MEKQDVFSGERVLIAKENGAYALHETVQGGGEEDFAALTYIQAIWNLASISDFLQCSDDTLVTDELIEDGDKLYIIRNDDSIAEFVASGVSGSGPYTMDTTAVTAGEVPIYVYKDNVELLYNDLVAIEDTRVLSIGPGTELVHNAKFKLNIDGWEQDGSSDLLLYWNESRKALEGKGNQGDEYHSFPGIPVVAGEEYRIEIVSVYANSSIAWFGVFQEDGTTLGLTEYDDLHFVENVVATGNIIYFRFRLPVISIQRVALASIKKKSLQIKRTYTDTVATGRSITTRFNLGAKGNELTHHQAGAFKERT